jgi:hypothetical protein
MIPHTAEMIRPNTPAFLQILRAGHPGVPVVVVSPLLRPDAEGRPNRTGATLAELRTAVEDAVEADGDERTSLIKGLHLVSADLLDDGIHPGDRGHQLLANVIGSLVGKALKCARRDENMDTPPSDAVSPCREPRCFRGEVHGRQWGRGRHAERGQVDASGRKPSSGLGYPRWRVPVHFPCSSSEPARSLGAIEWKHLR